MTGASVVYHLQARDTLPWELAVTGEGRPEVLVVGWDADRATFFAQAASVYTTADGSNRVDTGVRIGTSPYEIGTGRSAANLIRPWALVPVWLEDDLELAAGRREDRLAAKVNTNLAMRITDDVRDPVVHRQIDDSIRRSGDDRDRSWSVALAPLPPGPGWDAPVVPRHSQLNRADALLAAARLAAGGSAPAVRALQDPGGPESLGVGWPAAHQRRSDRTASGAAWPGHRFDNDWRLQWACSGPVFEFDELADAVNQAIALAVDGAPDAVVAAVHARWPALSGNPQHQLTALADLTTFVWQRGFPPAYRDAYLATLHVVDAVARTITSARPDAIPVLRALRTDYADELVRLAKFQPDVAPKPGPDSIAAAILASRLADGVDTPARAAADAAWQHCRVTAHKRASSDAFLNLYKALELSGGWRAAQELQVDGLSTDVVVDVLAAACNAPRLAVGPGDLWTPGAEQVAVDRVVDYVLDAAGIRFSVREAARRTAAKLAAEATASTAPHPTSTSGPTAHPRYALPDQTSARRQR
jgi:hypothetical protein